MNEEQQKLYDVLVRDGYYTKSFEEFQAQFQDSAYQDKVFGVVERDGLFTKGKDSFLEKYAVAEKKKDDTEFVSEVGSLEPVAVEEDDLLARHDSLEQTYMDAWKRMQDIQALENPNNQQIQELQELNTTFTTALNEYNQVADQIRSEAPKGQDPAERVRNLRQGVSRKNEDGGRSTVKMADMEVDGKFVAVPTLFPKDPNNYGPNPEDWVEFGEEDAMGAYDMALERGEVFEFDTPEEAREFAKGSWKEMEEEPPKDEFNKSLEFVNNRLIDRSDAGQVARELEYEFGDFGFNFDRGFEVGIGNYVKVTASNGETIDVNTNPQFLTDEDTQADLLRDFLIKNRGTTPKREVEQSIEVGRKELDRLKGVYEQTHGDYERAAAKVEEYRQKVQADESAYDEAEAKRLVDAVNAAAQADQKAVDEYNAVLNVQSAEIDELNRIAQEKRDEPDAFERTFGKNAVTDFIADNTYRPIIQGQAQSGTIRSSYDLMVNANDVTDEDIAEFLRAQAVLEEYGPSDEMRDFQRIYQEEGGGWGGFVSAVMKRPPPLGELFVSSVSMMANKEVAKGAFTVGISSAPLGLMGGPASAITVPAAFLTGAMGGAGATLEAGISFAEFLRDEMAEKQGVDPEKVVMDNEKIREVLSDPEAMSRIRYRAGGRGIAIGLTSLIGTGVAATATRRTAIKTGSKLKAAGAGAAIEMPFEGLGEAAGQIVAGQEMDVADILLETAAGGPAQVVGVGIGLFKAPQYTLNGELVSGKQMADFIRDADEADVAGATIEIKNDDTLAKQAHDKRDNARERVVIKEQLRKSGIENEETVDKLADLELEKRKLKGLETTAAERKRKRIQNEIDSILDGDSYFFEETTDEQGNKRSKEVRVTRRDAILALLEDDIVNPTEKEIEAKQAELFRDALADIQESDAVQEPSTEEVDVGEQPADGEEVGVGDTEEQAVAEEEEVVDEEAEELEAAFEAESTPDVEEDIDGVTVRRREGYEFGRKAQRVLDQAKKRVKALENFGVKIVLHENDAQFGAATNSTGRGLYDSGTKTIHINLDKANSRTVAHEAFHALFLERVKGDDAKAQMWAKATMKSVRKALDADSVLATRIDDFLTRYEENVIDEEALAEIFGYLSEGYGELTGPQQSRVKAAIKKLIELFGIKLESQWSQDDQNVIDVLNTLSGKMERGETITEEELSGLDVSEEKAKEVAEETTVDNRVAGLQEKRQGAERSAVQDTGLSKLDGAIGRTGDSAAQRVYNKLFKSVRTGKLRSLEKQMREANKSKKMSAEDKEARIDNLEQQYNNELERLAKAREDVKARVEQELKRLEPEIEKAAVKERLAEIREEQKAITEKLAKDKKEAKKVYEGEEQKEYLAGLKEEAEAKRAALRDEIAELRGEKKKAEPTVEEEEAPEAEATVEEQPTVATIRTKVGVEAFGKLEAAVRDYLEYMGALDPEDITRGQKSASTRRVNKVMKLSNELGLTASEQAVMQNSVQAKIEAEKRAAEAKEAEQTELKAAAERAKQAAEEKEEVEKETVDEKPSLKTIASSKDKKEVLAAIASLGNEYSAKKVFTALAKNPNLTAFERKLAEIIARRIPQAITIQVGGTRPGEDAHYFAEFDMDEGKLFRAGIAINPNLSRPLFESLLHEGVHALVETERLYVAGEISGELNRIGRLVRAYMKENANELKKKYPKTYRGYGQFFVTGVDQVKYATLPQEIITFALTNAEVQEIMKGIPDPDGGSVWNSFVESIRKMLGLTVKERTALDSVLEVLDRSTTYDVGEKVAVTEAVDNRNEMFQQDVADIEAMEVGDSIEAGDEVITKVGEDSFEMEVTARSMKTGNAVTAIFYLNRKRAEARAGDKIRLRDYRVTEVRAQNLERGDVITNTEDGNRIAYRVKGVFRNKAKGVISVEVEVLDIGNQAVGQARNMEPGLKFTSFTTDYVVGQNTTLYFKKSKRDGRMDYRPIVQRLDNWDAVNREEKAAPETEPTVEEEVTPKPTVDDAKVARLEEELRQAQEDLDFYNRDEPDNTKYPKYKSFKQAKEAINAGKDPRFHSMEDAPSMGAQTANENLDKKYTAEQQTPYITGLETTMVFEDSARAALESINRTYRATKSRDTTGVGQQLEDNVEEIKKQLAEAKAKKAPVDDVAKRAAVEGISVEEMTKREAQEAAEAKLNVARAEQRKLDALKGKTDKKSVAERKNIKQFIEDLKTMSVEEARAKRAPSAREQRVTPQRFGAADEKYLSTNADQDIKPKDGHVILYHKTSAESADAIAQEGFSPSLERVKDKGDPSDLTWFTDTRRGFGDSKSLVAVQVPESRVKNNGSGVFTVYGNISPEYVEKVYHGLEVDATDIGGTNFRAREDILRDFLSGNAKIGLKELLESGKITRFAEPKAREQRVYEVTGATTPFPNESTNPNLKVGDIVEERAVKGDKPNLFEYQMVNPNEIDYVEKELDYDAIVRMPTTRRYIRQYQQGEMAPPARVVRLKDGTLSSLNRRRIVAAREAGIEEVPAWVETTAPAQPSAREQRVVYHATPRRNKRGIQSKGIEKGRKAMWSRGVATLAGQRREGFDTANRTFVFSDLNDALQWAIKTKIEKDTQVSVVAVNAEGKNLQEDTALTQDPFGGLSSALYTEDVIAADDILGVQDVTIKNFGKTYDESGNLFTQDSFGLTPKAREQRLADVVERYEFRPNGSLKESSLAGELRRNLKRYGFGVKQFGTRMDDFHIVNPKTGRKVDPKKLIAKDRADEKVEMEQRAELRERDAKERMEREDVEEAKAQELQEMQDQYVDFPEEMLSAPSRLSPREQRESLQDNAGKFNDTALVKFAKERGYSDAAILKVRPTAQAAIDAYDAKATRLSREVQGIIQRARERARGDKKIQAIENKGQRTRAVNDRIIKDVKAYIQKSKMYEEASDVGREAMMRAVDKQMGRRIKAAPSVIKLLGLTPDGDVLIDKKGLLEQIRVMARSSKATAAASREIMREVGKDIARLKATGAISGKQATAILRKMANMDPFNPVQVENFVNYTARVFAEAEYIEEVNKLNKLRKRALKNASKKLGISPDLMPMLQTLLNMDARLVPENVFEKYKELVNDLGERKTVLNLKERTQMFDDVVSIMSGINEELAKKEELFARYEAYTSKADSVKGKIADMVKDEVITTEESDILNKYADELREERKMSEEEKEKAREEERAKLVDAIQRLPKLDRKFPTQMENKLVRRFNKLVRTEGLLGLSNADLKNVLRVADNIQNGFLPHTAQVLVEQVEVNNRAVVVEQAIKEAKLPNIARIRALLGGVTNNTAIARVVNRNPLRFIDQVYGDYRTTRIYDAAFKDLASSYASYKSDVMGVQQRLDRVEEKLIKSLGRNPNAVIRSKFLIGAYMMQAEFDTNPDVSGVFDAVSLLDETIKKSDRSRGSAYYSPATANVLRDIRKNIDGKSAEEIRALLSEEERAVADEIRSVNDELTPKAEYVAGVLRGVPFRPFSQYFHRIVLTQDDKAGLRGVDALIDEAKTRMRKPSTKAQNIQQRITTSPPAVNFDPFASARRGARYILTDYHMTEAVRTNARLMNKLEATDMTSKQRQFYNAIDNASEATIADALVQSYTISTIGEQAVEMLKRQGYRVVLADMPRMVGELLSNILFVSAAAGRQFAAGIGKHYNTMATNGADVMKNVGSVQTTRLYADSKTISSRMVESIRATTGPEKNDVGQAVFNRAKQIWAYSGAPWGGAVNSLADFMITTPDKIVTRPVWFGTFAEEFKARSGKEVDFDKIAANDEAYMAANEEAIKAATDAADLASVQTGATDNPFLGIVNSFRKSGGTAAGTLIKAINSYMTRFLVFEFVTARTAINASVGNGTITKLQGVKLLSAVLMRMVAYVFITNALRDMLDKALNIDEPEDDDKTLEEEFDEAVFQGIVSLVVGGTYGSVLRGVASTGIEFGRKELMEDAGLDFEYDDSVFIPLISPAQDGRPYKKMTDLLARLSGPYNPIVRPAILAGKLAFDSDKKEVEAIKRRDEEFYRLGLEVLGLMGMVPLYKDVRRLFVKEIYKDLDKDDTPENIEKRIEEELKKLRKEARAK